MTYVDCPRCGLSIIQRFPGQRIRHCPRCVAHHGVLVDLFPSPIPSAGAYAKDCLPRPDLLKPPRAREEGMAEPPDAA
jgi:hypothetical protein